MQTINLLVLNYRICGVILIVLGAAHAYFPRRLGWKKDAESMPLLTGQVFLVHSAYIGFSVFLCGLLCLLYAPDLVQPSRLAKGILIGLSIFWGSRLLVQLFVYDQRIWRGKRFESTMHVLFSLMWAYFALSFAAGVWQQLSG